MKKLLIVEDNEYTLNRLKMIADTLEAKVFATVSLPEAYQIACEHNIDVFMIDIVLQPHNHSDASGVRFALNLREIERYKRTPMIFITSIEDPGLSLYSTLHCFRYIEKPFHQEEVLQVLQEALQLPQVDAGKKKYVNFRIKRMNVIKRVEDIIYIEKVNLVMQVHAVDGTFSVQYKTIKETMNELEDNRFLQCSRNAVVNMDYVVSFDMVNRYVVLKDDWGRIEIGAKYKDRLLAVCTKL